MNRILSIASLVLALLLVGAGCSGEKNEDNTKVPLEVKKAESMDSTRLDSARADTARSDSLTGDVYGE